MAKLKDILSEVFEDGSEQLNDFEEHDDHPNFRQTATPVTFPYDTLDDPYIPDAWGTVGHKKHWDGITGANQFSISIMEGFDAHAINPDLLPGTDFSSESLQLQ